MSVVPGSAYRPFRLDDAELEAEERLCELVRVFSFGRGGRSGLLGRGKLSLGSLLGPRFIPPLSVAFSIVELISFKANQQINKSTNQDFQLSKSGRFG
jgi:hypothetical protein